MARHFRAAWIACGLMTLVQSPAQAAIVESSADHAVLTYSADLALNPAQAWAKLIEVRSWWSSDHTYSGAAANITLTPRAGGCWCETWDGNSVEHGRVLMAMPGKNLRVEAPFGPLQAMGVKAILDFTLSALPDNHGTRVGVRFTVNGTTSSKLDTLAPVLDGVMGAQIANLAASSPNNQGH